MIDGWTVLTPEEGGVDARDAPGSAASGRDSHAQNSANAR